MKHPKSQFARWSRLLPLVATLAATALLSGCSKDPDESQIPWARPATWEGGMPGMGGMSGAGR